MVYLIKTIGILILAAGVTFVVLPSLMQKIIEFVKTGKRIYIIGVARLILGGLLIWASPVATIMWIPAALGGLMVLSGIIVFAIGMSRALAVLNWWSSRTDTFRRVLAVLVAAIGALVIYSA